MRNIAALSLEATYTYTGLPTPIYLLFMKNYILLNYFSSFKKTQNKLRNNDEGKKVTAFRVAPVVN